MDFVFNGLPVHVLIVHLVVVLVPVTGLVVIAASVWPAARRWLGVVPALFSLVLLAIVPLTTSAGEWLADRVPETPLIEDHTDRGDQLLPWVIALAVVAVAVAQWVWFRLIAQRLADHNARRALRGVIAAVFIAASVAVGVGATISVIQIGESRARAIWDGSFSDQPLD